MLPRQRGLTQRAQTLGILPHFRAFFWLRVFSAPKQSPRRAHCPLRKALGGFAYQRRNSVSEKSIELKRKTFLDITLSESLLLAIAPFLAYLFAFVYQAGYVATFELPVQFVSIAIVDIFNIGGKVLGVFYGVIALVNFIPGLLFQKGKIPPFLTPRLIYLSGLLIFTYPTFFLFEWEPQSNWIALFIIFSIGIMFLPPLLTRKYKGSYLQKMEMLDSETKSGNMWEGSLVDRAANIIGPKIFIALVYFLLSINLTYNAGKAAALNQETFYFANTSPETVVLFMTSDRLISAPFNEATKMIESEYLVINLSTVSDLKLRLVNIGRLKLDKSSLTPLPTPTMTPLPTQTPVNAPLPVSTQTP